MGWQTFCYLMISRCEWLQTGGFKVSGKREESVAPEPRSNPFAPPPDGRASEMDIMCA